MTDEKIGKLPREVQEMFLELRKLIYSVAPSVEERMWAGLPSYYIGKAFVRLISFKDHVNIEASAIPDYKARLDGYKFTPKNMLQIFVGQTIPSDVLTAVFRNTLVL